MITNNPAIAAELAPLGATQVVPLTPNHLFIHTLKFPLIAAGGNDSKVLRIVDSALFIVDKLNIYAALNGAFNAAIDYTPLPRYVANAVGSNTMPCLDVLRIAVQQNDRPWMNDMAAGIRPSLLFANESNPGYLPYKVAIAGGDSVNITIWNDGPAPIRAEVALIGHRLPLNIAA